MSAILSADDLNDFISPGVACIKPVETLPAQRPDAAGSSNPYEVTTEDNLPQNGAGAPAQISLTDCLACSGCVTSAEAVLVGLQSHDEVLKNLDQFRSVLPHTLSDQNGGHGMDVDPPEDGMVFVASVSPQTKANIAATYGISTVQAGYLIEQLLAGPSGLKRGGRNGSGFTWIIDTNLLRQLCQTACFDEALVHGNSQVTPPKSPILSSACPGWICYAEKTHPHVLSHLSRIKSPQALSGTLIKSILSRRFGIPPDKVWHLAVMPCFDKKLEASREELTDAYWRPNAPDRRGVRDVDCVITAREVVMLAETRGISLPNLPKTPVKQPAFPDERINAFLFPCSQSRSMQGQTRAGGSSGGYAYQILKAKQAQIPGSTIQIERGRNVDVVDYLLVQNDQVLMKTARYYGFRNIQNLVRRLKPPKASRLPGSKLASRNGAPNASAMKEYAYIEVMACPGGCTNGGGQIKISDMESIIGTKRAAKTGPAEQKEWLARVDEAYYSADSSSEDEAASVDVNGSNGHRSEAETRSGGLNGVNEQDEVKAILEYWSSSTGIELKKLLCTSYREVESDVGKTKGRSDMERVAGLASTLGGGW